MSACFVSPAVVNLVFYNAPALNALPVYLLRQGFMFSSFEGLFWCWFSVRLFGGLGGTLGGHWVDFGAIRGAFWCHIDDFFRIRWIFKNVCFTIVKQYLLRSGRVLVGDIVALCFWIDLFKLCNSFCFV